MVKRDIASRYRGSFLGMLWSVATPLMMLAVYTFIFTEVFKAKWPSANGVEETGKYSFAITIFSGMIIHGFIAECMTRSSSIILQNSSYVKKVVFPLELLPIMVSGSALFNMMISTIILYVANLAFADINLLSLLALPVLFIPLILFATGLGLLISSVGVYLRDISQLIGLFVMILLFISPVFFPVDAIPEKYRIFMQVNPLSWFIESFRSIIISSNLPDLMHISVIFTLGILSFLFGLLAFSKMRKGFADVL